MDERLIPINGLIALLRGEGRWPGVLRDQGFKRHQLELPISTPLGDIRADALIYRCAPDLILLCEGKSGRNIEEAQARKYVAADFSWLRRTGVIPPELKNKDDVEVRTLFIGREEHRTGLETGLRKLDIDAPLLTVSADRVHLSEGDGILGLDDFDVPHEGGLPPGRIPVDHQSSKQDLLEVLLQQIAAAQARSEDIVSVESLAERVLPEWPVLSHGARGDFIARIAEVLRQLAAGEMRGQFRYERLAQPHTRGRLVIEATPAARDARGRTQAWQALQRKAGAALQRRLEREAAGQLSLDELADQGGLAEE